MWTALCFLIVVVVITPICLINFCSQVSNNNIIIIQIILLYKFFVGLFDLADSYCEAQLKEVCAELIWQQVSVENVAMLIAMATKYKTEVYMCHPW